MFGVLHLDSMDVKLNSAAELLFFKAFIFHQKKSFELLC